MQTSSNDSEYESLGIQLDISGQIFVFDHVVGHATAIRKKYKQMEYHLPMEHYKSHQMVRS